MQTLKWIVLLPLALACHPSKDGATGDSGTAPTEAAPTIQSRSPEDGATGVPINASASATFSADMVAASLQDAITMTTGSPPETVSGAVIYADRTAVFWPSAHLHADQTYTVTVDTGARSAAGVALAADASWTFTTGDTVEPGRPVDLGSAGTFAVLAKSGVSTVPPSALTGDLGVSPAAASYLTGFSLAADPTNVFSTSPQVVGKVFAADYAAPTPAELTAAVLDLELAFDDAASRAPDVTELGAGDIGGLTLEPGVYAWGTSLQIPTDLTLNGSATDVWIFQVAQDLVLSSGVRVVLTGGAQPANVFWQVAGLVDLGTTAHAEGVVLTRTSVTLATGASIQGRLLAQTAVSLDQAVVVQPSP